MRRTLSPLSWSVGLAALSMIFAAGCGDLTQPNYNQLPIQKDPDAKAATTARSPSLQQAAGPKAPAAMDKPGAATQPAGATGAQQPAGMKAAPAVKPVMVPQPAQMPAGPSCGG